MIYFSFLCYFIFLFLSVLQKLFYYYYLLIFFRENYFYSFMFQNVPCSGFIDAQA